MSFESAGIVGGGAWGTALAAVVARAGLKTRIWAREPDVVATINEHRENTVFLPGVELPEGIQATGQMADLGKVDFVLMVAPAQFTGQVAKSLTPHIGGGVPLVICSKGIEKTTGRLMSEVLEKAAPGHPIAVLSGPTFASEVARGLPSAVTLAARDEALAQRLADALAQPTFRAYWSDDIIGAQIGGSIKNILAIACGIVEGKGLGENVRATLITRGLAEMVRFGRVKGARPETLRGLSGMGDLILTCSSIQSRNMSLGKALGEGQSMKDILAGRKSVSEGVHSAVIVHELARKLDIDMPIVSAVFRVLHENADVDKEVEILLNRPGARESD